jgi:hypothetical protein
MSGAGFVRWEIWALDTDPDIFTFYTDDATAAQIAADDLTKRADLTGYTFRLAFEWEGGSLRLITGTDAEFTILNQAVAADKGQLQVVLSASQRALFPLDGRTIRWSLQSVLGSVKDTWLFGEVSPVRWVANA